MAWINKQLLILSMIRELPIASQCRLQLCFNQTAWVGKRYTRLFQKLITAAMWCCNILDY